MSARATAILRVNPQSSYAKYNGGTYEITEIMDGLVCLKLNDTTFTDFTFAEVNILNFDHWFQHAEDQYLRGEFYGRRHLYHNLKKYADAKGICIADRVPNPFPKMQLTKP